MIETLPISQDSEALSVLKQAFAYHPLLPPDTPSKTRECLLQLMLDTLGRVDNAWLHGIRKNGALVCVAFSLDSQAELEFRTIISLFFSLFRMLGWRMTREFFRAFSQRSEHQDPYLELMLLGTLPAFHGEGLGRKMLRFLYGFAEAQQYRGVILSAAKETPAFRFYLSEGFVVDSEISINDIPLCNMRRDHTQ